MEFGLTLAPIFFLTNANLLPLQAYGFHGLDVFISSFLVLILDNGVIGHIPLCTPINFKININNINTLVR